MSFWNKALNSILFKFAAGILGLLVISLLLFLWHIHLTEHELLESIYNTRKKQIEHEIEKNVKAAAKNRLALIKLEMERYEKELAEALFTVDDARCKQILADIAAFPSVKGAELYDELVGTYFLTVVKKGQRELLFSRSPVDLKQFRVLNLELYRKDHPKPIGFIKVFYDPSVFTKDARELGKEALAALNTEYRLALRTLKKNFIKHILGLVLIFAVLYLAIYFLFSKFINDPIKKLEYNLKCFFNFLAKKDNKVALYEIDSDDEFGQMGRFINNGIEVSIKIHQELENHAKEVSKLATVIEQSAQAILITDLQGNIEYVNKAFEKTTGYTFEEVKGKNPRILKSGQHSEAFYRKLWQTITSGESWQGVFTNKKKDGTLYYERSIIFPVKNQNGDIINYAAAKQDITKERSLEQQLRQAQKMESIGTLAGGIAHDFNNLLTVINGFVELALLNMDPKDPVRKNISAVLEASKKAQTLTSQLLAFSRKQIYQPEIVNINEVISSMEKMMRRLIGEDIDIETRLADNLPLIKADASQLEQIFVNLVVNARDALNAAEKEGFRKKITIETGQVELGTDYVDRHPGSRPGKYVYFAVSDNGIGMDEETRQKIFEPFFTTKEKHRGTGLGLSMVYGIVKQNEGFIYVYSEPGEGSTFKIYWPVTEETEQGKSESSKEEEIVSGSERILLVEDEEDVRLFAKSSLESLGYQVFTASNGKKALEMLRNGLKVDLIVTDLIMPEMNGREFVEKAKGLFPEGKVIYVSGYTDDHLTRNHMIDKGINFLPKPFSIRQIASIVRKVLDGK